MEALQCALLPQLPNAINGLVSLSEEKEKRRERKKGKW
jgi:hypothetical protein